MGMWFIVSAFVAFFLLGFLTFLILFEPGLEYKVVPPSEPLDCDQFLHTLSALSDAEVHRSSQVHVLTNGDAFYEGELEVIRSATQTIHLERYIFEKGEIAGRYIEAISERARAGVKVKIVLDYIGSFTAWEKYLQPLKEAGARLCWYQPIRWDTAKRFNNRTHRDLLIVDGRTGFIGGAGIADWWLRDTPKAPRWRDTMCRVEGDMVTGLQTCFAENWLESSGEVLIGDNDYFPTRREAQTQADAGGGSGMVVISSPSAGRGTRARILFQVLLASAKTSIDITTPYFLPDRSARREMIDAIRKRGVKLRILVPGRHSDHILTRRAGRRRFGRLLKAGAEIYEYEPAMIHAKVMVVDGIWCVVGSTNFDNRSFGINDEVNLAMRDAALAKRLGEDFTHDLTQSHAVSHEQWVRRPLHERVLEFASRILERQS